MPTRRERERQEAKARARRLRENREWPAEVRARRAEAEARAAEGAKVSDHLVLDLEPRAVPLRAAPGRGGAMP
jgi:hypothetical protein